MLFRYSGKDGYSIYENQVGSLQMGKFSSTSQGYGLPLTKVNSFGFRVCADDKGVVFVSGASVRANESRLLLTAAHTGNVSAHGHEAHLKITGDESGVTGILGGSWGYIEMVSGAKVNYAGGVRSMLDCPSGAEISGVLSAFLAAANDISGTHTGPATVIHVPNPVSGTFDFFAVFGAAPGGIAAKATALSGLTSTHRLIVKCPDGNTGYIPIIETWA